MRFSELVNIGKLRDLCESFTAVTGAVTAIADLDGNVISASGWQDICSRFHRTNAQTAERCRLSDSVPDHCFGAGERYCAYRCQNGLIEVALPITIAGEHVATFFTGQFLFEAPDREYFIRQAQEFGFDQESYLEALNRVPILSEEKLRAMLEFFNNLVQMIGEMGLAAKNLEAANDELRMHQGRLEELVAERTSELSKVNAELRAEIAERTQVETAQRETEQRLRTLASATFEGVVITEDGRITDANEQFSQIVGYKQSELLQMKLADLVAPADVHRVMANILADRESDIEHEIVCKDGSCRIVEAHGKPLHRDGERHLRIAAVRDVTGRKRIEAEIRQLNGDLAARAAELEAANKDLEAFNHTVAHDLRQPLNFVSLCCQALQVTCGDAIKEGCASYVNDIDQAVRRMDRLIGALLGFSQMGRVEPRREAVDLSALAREACRSLQVTAAGRQVEFRVADGVVADCDANLLQVVLANLFGNAWKYTGMRDKAVIEFGVAETDGVPTYFVRDNGDGFDMSHADKLFTPFLRLPGSEKSEGFGIGLATVQRIVQKHGGKVWAESGPGKGATIYFTLSAS